MDILFNVINPAVVIPLPQRVQNALCLYSFLFLVDIFPGFANFAQTSVMIRLGQHGLF